MCLPWVLYTPNLRVVDFLVEDDVGDGVRGVTGVTREDREEGDRFRWRPLTQASKVWNRVWGIGTQYYPCINY